MTGPPNVGGDLLIAAGLGPDGPGRRAALIPVSRGRWEEPVALGPAVPPPDGDHAGLGDTSRLPWVIPTRTAVWEVDPATLASRERWSHPWFHDVHSAAWRGDALLVTATGWEAVLELDQGGEIAQSWILGACPAPRHDARRDPHDRNKPHQVHPNHAFDHDGQVWITCLAARMVRSTSGAEVRFPGGPHDGVRRGDLWWFTTVEGRLLGVELPAGRIVVDIDVVRAERRAGHPGWCRGVEVRGDRAWVGFTQERGSRWREMARAALRGPKAPTRIVEVDLGSGRVVGSSDLPGGEGAIYAIYSRGGDGR